MYVSRADLCILRITGKFCFVAPSEFLLSWQGTNVGGMVKQVNPNAVFFCPDRSED